MEVSDAIAILRHARSRPMVASPISLFVFSFLFKICSPMIPAMITVASRGVAPVCCFVIYLSPVLFSLFFLV